MALSAIMSFLSIVQQEVLKMFDIKNRSWNFELLLIFTDELIIWGKILTKCRKKQRQILASTLSSVYKSRRRERKNIKVNPICLVEN